MLTGMGNDGAVAMQEMKDAGSYNYVKTKQPASCLACRARPLPMALPMRCCRWGDRSGP